MKEKENAREPSVIFTPATQRVVPMNKQMFATILSMIPAGKLIIFEAIDQMWVNRKGGNARELQGRHSSPLQRFLLAPHRRPADNLFKRAE